MDSHDKSVGKLVYHSPQIARVLLRREQAVLSDCSASAFALDDMALLNCVYDPNGGACRRAGISYVGPVDSAASMS